MRRAASAPPLGSEISSVVRNSRSALSLFRRRLVVHAIDQRHARPLAGFRRRHVGEDHELFDQPVRFQPLRHDHAIDGAVGLEQDLALGQFEIERTALVAGVAHRPVGGVKRLEHLLDDRFGDFVGPAGDRELGLLVVQPRRRADQHAMEAVRSACGRRRRSPCAPRAPGDPRAAAASKDRWRCAPAASARRGRENRPSCRVRALRDRAPSPGAHNARRRQWRR